jgi:hypothetical protein
MNSQEVQRIMAVKSALVTMTGSPGWPYFKQIAMNVVDVAVSEALDEENPDKGEAKRLKAKALKKGFNDLFNAVEITSNFAVADETQDDGLGDLELTNLEL